MILRHLMPRLIFDSTVSLPPATPQAVALDFISGDHTEPMGLGVLVLSLGWEEISWGWAAWLATLPCSGAHHRSFELDDAWVCNGQYLTVHMKFEPYCHLQRLLVTLLPALQLGSNLAAMTQSISFLSREYSWNATSPWIKKTWPRTISLNITGGDLKQPTWWTRTLISCHCHQILYLFDVCTLACKTQESFRPMSLWPAIQKQISFKSRLSVHQAVIIL